MARSSVVASGSAGALVDGTPSTAAARGNAHARDYYIIAPKSATGIRSANERRLWKDASLDKCPG